MFCIINVPKSFFNSVSIYLYNTWWCVWYLVNIWSTLFKSQSNTHSRFSLGSIILATPGWPFAEVIPESKWISRASKFMEYIIWQTDFRLPRFNFFLHIDRFNRTMTDITPKKRSITEDVGTETPNKRKSHSRPNYITPEEKTLVKQLQVRLTPRSTLRMARQLGREPEQVKAWQKVHSPDSFQSTTSPKLFTEHMKVLSKGKAYKNKYRGCGPFCKQNDALVLCPSCKRWFWHVSCLKQIYEKRGIVCTTPIGDDSDWKCIHCLKAHWELQSLIWISWDLFSNLFVQLIYTLKPNVDWLLTKYWPITE